MIRAQYFGSFLHLMRQTSTGPRENDSGNMFATADTKLVGYARDLPPHLPRHPGALKSASPTYFVVVVVVVVCLASKLFFCYFIIYRNSNQPHHCVGRLTTVAADGDCPFWGDLTMLLSRCSLLFCSQASRRIRVASPANRAQATLPTP
jgi:hypothetical protein